MARSKNEKKRKVKKESVVGKPHFTLEVKDSTMGLVDTNRKVNSG